MRTGLDAPTDLPSADELERTRAYLDGQSLIELAIWVRHEQLTGDGPAYDHHLMLGIPDEEYGRVDLRALDWGLGAEAPLPGWVDLYPLSEVEQLRSFGILVWEARSDRPAGLDPLDFHLVYEAPEIAPNVRASVAAEAGRHPGVVGLDAYVCRLLRGDEEVEVGTRICVRWDRSSGTVPPRLEDVVRAVGAMIPRVGTTSGGSLTHAKPDWPHTTLFDLEAVR